METRAHHILIGLFTVLACGALLVFILWMSRSGTDGAIKRYDVLFREAVSGLSVGSVVQYSGIRVGEVERLRLDPQDPRQVWARIRVSASTPVKTDTSARLALLNITGAAGIELGQGTPASPFLESNGDIIPVIEAEPSPLTQLRLSSEQLLVNVTTLVENANRLLSEENSNYVTSVLANLDSVTSALAEEQQILHEGLQALITAGNDMSRLITAIEETTLQHSGPLLSRATETLENIQRVSQQLDGILQENRSALNEGMQGVADFNPAMRELRSALNSLNTLILRINDDPTGFVLGGDSIREYQP
ncbi:MAG TPA: MlaD family protein [Pseudohongiella sp.]|nr:MlaD family protein [Pseudohongiella sp.]